SQCCAQIARLKLAYQAQLSGSRGDALRLAALREDEAAKLRLQSQRVELDRKELGEQLRRLRVSLSQAEERRDAAVQEAQAQRALESQLQEEQAAARQALQDKEEQLLFVSHALEEETRRRGTAEQGLLVLEQSLARAKGQLSDAGARQEELQKVHFQLQREQKERARVEQSLGRVQRRLKDLQAVRDALESQAQNVRQSHQEEASRRRRAEAALEAALRQKNPQLDSARLRAAQQGPLDSRRSNVACRHLLAARERLLAEAEKVQRQAAEVCLQLLENSRCQCAVVT
ncbi:uncharacterized protein ACB058_021531, partial [Synchiropus picturatus]